MEARKILGYGAFGTVYAIDDDWCVKITRINKSTEFLKELDVLLNVRHDNIIKCFDVRYGEEVEIIMERADGNLHDFLMQGNLSLLERARVVYDIGVALDFLWDHHIHGDLSLENILMKNGRALLSDFGCASRTFVGGTSDVSAHAMHGITYIFPHNMAHEEVSHVEREVYGYGLLAIVIMTGGKAIEKLTPLMEEEYDWESESREDSLKKYGLNYQLSKISTKVLRFWIEENLTTGVDIDPIFHHLLPLLKEMLSITGESRRESLRSFLGSPFFVDRSFVKGKGTYEKEMMPIVDKTQSLKHIFSVRTSQHALNLYVHLSKKGYKYDDLLRVVAVITGVIHGYDISLETDKQMEILISLVEKENVLRLW